MPTNISYATDDLVDYMVLSILPNIPELTADGILNSNFALAALDKKGARDIDDGGLEIWGDITKQENTNAQWQGKSEEMKATAQDPAERLRYPYRVFTASVVTNDLEKAQASGKFMIKDLVKRLTNQAITTIGNAFNSGLWVAAPSGNQPNSIPSLIPATTAGAQTGTHPGGITRVGHPELQTDVYTTAIADIGSEAGISQMVRLRARSAIGKDMVDIILLDEANWAGLAAYLTTLMRYAPGQSTIGMDIEYIQMGKCFIGFESTRVFTGANTITAGRMYGINSKHMKIKVLKEGNGIWEKTFERVGRSLNKALYYKWFGNLCDYLPRAHFCASSVATT